MLITAYQVMLGSFLSCFPLSNLFQMFSWPFIPFIVIFFPPKKNTLMTLVMMYVQYMHIKIVGAQRKSVNYPNILLVSSALGDVIFVTQRL